MSSKTCSTCLYKTTPLTSNWSPCTTCKEYDNWAGKFGEPLPIPNSSRPVWEVVIEDMFQRNEFGKAKYGTPLQANNGRNALKDAYEEVLDLAVYLKQKLMEEQNDNGNA